MAKLKVKETKLQLPGYIASTANKNGKDGPFSVIVLWVSADALRGKRDTLQDVSYHDITVVFEAIQTELLDDTGEVPADKEYRRRLSTGAAITGTANRESKDGAYTVITVVVDGENLSGRRDLLEELSYKNIDVSFRDLVNVESDELEDVPGQTNLLGDDADDQ